MNETKHDEQAANAADPEAIEKDARRRARNRRKARLHAAPVPVEIDPGGERAALLLERRGQLVDAVDRIDEQLGAVRMNRKARRAALAGARRTARKTAKRDARAASQARQKAAAEAGVVAAPHKPRRVRNLARGTTAAPNRTREEARRAARATPAAS